MLLLLRQVREMEVRALLERMGYKGLVSNDWYGRINDWAAWYAGKTKFHSYTIYNGTQDIPCKRKSLCMAKKVCEDKADLLLNEKVTITVAGGSGNAAQDYLDAVLEAQNFWVRGNQLVELANAAGTGAFVEYKDNDTVCIDFVSASCVWPLSWYNGDITECAFVSTFTLGMGGTRIYINRHVLENGKYVVYNDMFDESGKPVELPDGVIPKWETGSVTPLFQIITPNIANNIDLTNPMGISVYANVIDVLQTIDLVYDSYHNEIKLGKKRIFVDDTVVKPNPKDGSMLPIFDPNDTVFYGIPGKDNEKSITESNMNLRVEAHQLALQSSLDILSELCGFGKGYYKFDADEVQTATAVVSQNSKLFRKIKKDEIILDKALTDMVRALLFLGGFTGEYDISINFDDSIIEDTDAIARRAMLELGAGIIDNVLYFERVYGMTEEAAAALVQKIAGRSLPDDEPPYIPEGD